LREQTIAGLTEHVSSAAYYRTEAERCRELAKSSPDVGMAARWRQLANEYEVLAQSLMHVAPSAVPRPNFQVQPMQQQQGKLGEDDPAED
jgi:hypothetical protein